MKKARYQIILGVIFGVLLFAQSASAKTPTPSPTPSLEETLKFIRSKVAGQYVTSGCEGSKDDFFYREGQIKVQIVNNSLEIEFEWYYNDSYKKREATSKYKKMVILEKLISSNYKVIPYEPNHRNCNITKFINGFLLEFNIADSDETLKLYFKEKDLAERVGKAFAHAIKLGGGKDEPF